ncbi:hypothetical protein E3U55_05040 [Filobacillus milosensis]|uniref:Swarming motility protein SwrB n=1 Tax=Filobacillus milosensis TaxID=94137 RepID=A0A4Y8INR5_9BACI|nr:hypothetical protein [Filobacillus milosensis]TFB23185.1 hypothetical protein E3U55_05040 [Filobacillus milosensis]
MTQLLIFISLILHGVTFFVIFGLYQKLQKVNEGESHFNKRVQETEDLFSSYLLEIKDENKKFIDTISKINHQPSASRHKTERSKATIETKVEEPIPFPNYETSEETSKTFQPETIEVNDRSEQPSIQTQIMHLYQNGYTIEEIAKRLNKGNTEIELIVKFNQKMYN